MSRGQLEVIDEILMAQPNAMTHAELAQIMGAHPSSISRMKAGRELDFDKMIIMFEALNVSKTYQKELILLQTRPKNVVSAMEYVTVLRDFDTLEALLSRATDSNQAQVKEAKAIYDIYSAYQKYEISDEVALASLLEVKTTVFKNKVLHEILLTTLKRHLNDYRLLEETNRKMVELLPKIRCPFLQESFSNRLLELRAYNALHRECDTRKAKELAHQILDVSFECLKVKGSPWYILATAEMFSDYDQALYYLTRYCEVEKLDISRDSDVQFLKVHWGKARLEELSDPSEMAHWYAKNGYEEEAIQILDQIPPSPFRTYYRALATNRTDLLMKAFAEFMIQHSFFFANVLKEFKGPIMGDIVSHIQKTINSLGGNRHEESISAGSGNNA